MTHDAKHTPILCLDVQGFTTHDRATQRTILLRLQDIATKAARFFMPYGDVWAKWTRHGAGDGYYFVFDALSPQMALRYALNIDTSLAAQNAQHGEDLAIRLYGALVLGDVELVGDQYLSEAFSEAARFLSHQPLKDSLGRQDRPMVLAMSVLFHTEWRTECQRDNRFPETTTLHATINTDIRIEAPTSRSALARPCRIPWTGSLHNGLRATPTCQASTSCYGNAA